MIWAIKIMAALALAAVAFFGVTSCQEHYREQGRVEVRTQWLDADKTRELAERQDTIERQRAEREKEQNMARAAEENARETQLREEHLRGSIVDLQRRNGKLREQLARADAASRERRGAGACAAADAEADDAARARDLLGACADRYRGMAEDAAGLASQVMGLQDHVLVLQPQAAALLRNAEAAP